MTIVGLDVVYTTRGPNIFTLQCIVNELQVTEMGMTIEQPSFYLPKKGPKIS